MIKNPFDIGAESVNAGLIIEKYPSFLSPSSLNQWKGQPNKFILERMVKDPRPKDPQSIAAAAGSAFDYQCKMYLKDILGINLRDRLLANMFDKDLKQYYTDKGTDDKTIMWETNIEKQNREEADRVGSEIFRYYVKNGFAPAMYRDIEVRRTFNLTVNGKGVPLYGILDGIVFDEEYGINVPSDWKVSGYGSQEGVSPKPGYMESWSNGQALGSHKEYQKDMPFEQINMDWALQGCTYGWMIGLPLLKPFPFYIDMIAIRSGSIKVARYRGIITEDFQKYVAGLYLAAWTDIMTGTILERVGCTRLLAESLANNERWYS